MEIVRREGKRLAPLMGVAIKFFIIC